VVYQGQAALQNRGICSGINCAASPENPEGDGNHRDGLGIRTKEKTAKQLTKNQFHQQLTDSHFLYPRITVRDSVVAPSWNKDPKQIPRLRTGDTFRRQEP
jgi:hypothetical protein